MTITFALRRALPAILLCALLGACATPAGSHSHDAHNYGSAMDMQAMCEHHRKEMAVMSPAEQRAHMDEHMKDMSPEMRARMQAMMEQCR